MSSIKSKNTVPEILLAIKLKNKGVKFKKHENNLPGKPDLVIDRYKLAIFVHGCFWHQHKGCKRCSMPKTNIKYWKPKLEGNIKRFNNQRRILNRMGWHVFVVWECQVKKDVILDKKIQYIFKKLGVDV